MKIKEFFEKKYLQILSAAFLFILLLPMGYSVKAEDVIIEPVYDQTEVRSMLDSINEFRTGSDAWYWNSSDTEKVVLTDLQPLAYDYDLEKVAMQRAAEIAVYWSHTRPDGSSTWSAYSDLGYSSNGKGENIAAGQTSAASAFTAWREDNDKYSGQGHRRNMLNSNYKAIGMACVIVNGTRYWVQEFSTNTPTGSATDANDSATRVTVKVSDSLISNVTYTVSDIEVDEGSSVAFPTGTAKAEFNGRWPGGSVEVKNEVTFTSGDGVYVTIENGMIKGLKAGTGTISGTLLGSSVQVNVKVKAVATATPVPTATPMPTATPVPTATPMPSATPVPTATPIPTTTPLPTSTLVPTGSVTPTGTPVPTNVVTPTPTVTDVPATPTPTPTVVTLTPTPVPDQIVRHEEYIKTTNSYSQKIELNTNLRKETTVDVTKTTSDGTKTSVFYKQTSNARIRLVDVTTSEKFFGNYTIPSYVKVGKQKYYITSIESYAFEKNKLKKITIGSKVKTIKKNAFRNQKNLKEIVITAAKLKTVGKNAFKNISKNSVFKIKGSESDFERVKKLIIDSGISSSVTFEHIES